MPEAIDIDTSRREFDARMRREHPELYPTEPAKPSGPGPRTPARPRPAGPGRRGTRGRTGKAGSRSPRAAASRTARSIPGRAASSSAGGLVIAVLGWTLGAVALAIVLGMGGKISILTRGANTFLTRFLSPADPLNGNPFRPRPTS